MSNEPSENWDDDFLFQVSDLTRPDHKPSHSNSETTNTSNATTQITPHDPSDNTTRSRFSINSAAWEDPDAGPSKAHPIHEHDTRLTPNLSAWSEANVPQAAVGDNFSSLGGRNHHDLDRTLTARRKGKQAQSTTASTSTRPRSSDKSWAEDPDDGMYDRDFEDEQRLPPSNDSRAPSVASTTSSHRLERYRSSRQQSSSSLQLPASLTIRARANTPTHRPTSPTASTFSTLQMSSPVPSHLALTSQSSGRPLISPPPTSPHRPRRRLRKKSRPQDVDSNIFEMITDAYSQNPNRSEYEYLDEESAEQLLFDEIDEDRAEQVESPTLVPPRPISPPTIPPPLLSPAGPAFPVVSPPSSPPKAPLLSRLGSVKRWRSRRSSTASKDLVIDTSMESTSSAPYAPPKTPEPSFSRSATPSSPSSSRNWLFRVSPATKATPSPELQRENSKSRFGKRRSTTVEEVLMEEDEEPSEKNKVKGKGKGVISRVINHSKNPKPEPDMDETPRQSSAALSKRGSGSVPRRPLSLQPQSRPSTSQTVAGWAASVGRSTSNPFVAAKSKENSRASDSDGGQSLESAKKRLPNSSSIRKQGHKRSLSLTSDPDEINMSRAGAVLSESPPPVPPLPPGVASATSSSSSVLPPIALSPPSPPKVAEKPSHNGRNNPAQSSDLLSPSTPPASPSLPTFNGSRHIGNKSSAPPSPGQSFSLGRGTQHHQSHLLQEVAASAASPNFDPNTSSLLSTSFSTVHLRRSSLGDLKIPARISMAQTGLKNNLGMVREFANKVDELQRLREIRLGLLDDLGRSDDTVRPSDLSLPVSAALDRVEKRYALWWECAELLVELGGSGGPKDKDVSPLEIAPSVSPIPNGDGGDDDPTVTGDTLQPGKSRDRAVTLAGNEQAPPILTYLAVKSPSQATPSSQWRASTGRHDLSGRQLTLLREMLATPDPSAFNRHHSSSSGLRFSSQPISGYAAASAVTLPSIPSSPVMKAATDSSLTSDSAPPLPKEGKGRFHRAGLAGLTGIRDILRLLTNKPPLPSPVRADLPPSASSLSSTSDADVTGEGRKQYRKRRSTDAKSTVNSTSIKHANSPYNTTHDRKSPRRPSLASIFRIGQSHSNGVPPANGKLKKGGRKGVESQHAYPARPGTNSTTEEDEDYSDWDRMDSTSDIEIPVPSVSPGTKEATVKGRRHVGRNLRKRPATAQSTTKNASQVSFQLQDSPVVKRRAQPLADSYLDLRPTLNANQSPTVRSAPNVPLSDFKLALTPENIRPLLEYAREVSTRLGECVGELRELRQLSVIDIVS